MHEPKLRRAWLSPGPAGEMPQCHSAEGLRVQSPTSAGWGCQQTLPAFALSSRILLFGSALQTGSPRRKVLERERSDSEGASLALAPLLKPFPASSLLYDYERAPGGRRGGGPPYPLGPLYLTAVCFYSQWPAPASHCWQADLR